MYVTGSVKDIEVGRRKNGGIGGLRKTGQEQAGSLLFFGRRRMVGKRTVYLVDGVSLKNNKNP